MRFDPVMRSVSVRYTLAAMSTVAFASVDSPPASAQSAPPPTGNTFANRFDGWSFGVGGGYNAFHANTEATSSLSKGPDLDATGTYDPKQWFAVFEAGRDFRHGNFVLGLFGDVQAGPSSQNFASSGTKGSNSSELKLDTGASVVGHAGFVVNDAVQLYGLFGWSFRHYDATVTGTDFNTSTTYSREQSGWLNGPTVGAGAEMFLPNLSNVTLKGEYRFTSFNGPTIVADSSGLMTTVSYGRISSQSVRAVLSVKLPTH